MRRMLAHSPFGLARYLDLSKALGRRQARTRSCRNPYLAFGNSGTNPSKTTGWPIFVGMPMDHGLAAEKRLGPPVRYDPAHAAAAATMTMAKARSAARSVYSPKRPVCAE